MNPKQREHSVRLRDRGRILTPDGLSRLQQAIRAWELEHESRCTQERIKELTSAVKEGGLDPGTIRKILKAKDGVDPESIRCLFTTFGLQLNETDLAASSRLQVQADPNFVGREGAIADLNALVNRGVKVIVIQARGGVGKTTLARKYLQQEFGSFLEFPIAKETKDIASIESLIEEKLRQLGEEPGREFFVSLDRLKRKLQEERIGILIDNLEPALDAAGKFIEPHRRYVELLRVLTDPAVQSVTLITSRERLRESSVTVEHYMLRSLDVEAWEQFFQSRNLATDISAFAAIHNAYGGNAKAMDIIRGAILEDYSGDVAAYWQANQHDLFIERDLEDLVTQQFDRLQQIDLDAYNLLCRMGCYRYQDIPTVQIEGLFCLLWDMPENRQRRVMKSLQDRSLVEFENGKFWLHPVIRGEAIGRLRQGEDWELTNQKTAELWTKSVTTIQTTEDALKVLEAYYHYLGIKSFEKASNVILERRELEWMERRELERIDIDFEDLTGCNLGASLIRLGLLQQVSLIIAQVTDKITDNLSLSVLYSMLGESYWLTGRIKKGIEYHEKSKKAAVAAGNTRRKIVSLLHLGLCKMTLWEIEEARDLLMEISSIAEGTKYHRYAIKSWYCLAYLNSLSFSREEASLYCDKVYDSLSTVKLGVRTTGYRFYYLGIALGKLGKNQRSFEMHQQAILYAEKSNFSQLKAISSLGLSELYRNQNDFRLALELNLESVEVLERIDDKCDLADAYYQLGLTYQAMGEVEKSNESFQEAIRFFIEMEAPKQVERVRRSMKEV